MARVHNNIFVRGLTGSVGDQFVIRKSRSGKTIIANKPAFDENREFTANQKAQQEAFRRATSYAKQAKDLPIYAALAQGTGASSYNIAIADWFGTPEVLELDTSEWTGQPGQIIHVRAQDNVRVASVVVSIQDALGNELEQAPAVQADGLWWRFTTTTSLSMAPGVRVSATARDLPGHTHSMIWTHS